MGAKATGNIERVNGRPAYVRVLLKSGKTARIRLEPSCTELEAQSERRYWAAKAASGELVETPKQKRGEEPKHRAPGETVAAYAERWLAEREGRGLTSVRDSRSALKHHVLPILGPYAMRDVTRADVERVVEHLDDLVRARSSGQRDDRGRRVGIFSKSARNIFGTMAKMFADASASKRRELRARTDNPAAGVRGPDVLPDREGTYLFPREAAALLACDAVPVRWRAIYAVALYTGLRRGELVTLRAENVKLAEGYIAISKAHNRATKGEKCTKSGKTRRLPIEPALKPLLKALCDNPQGAGGRLLDVPTDRTMADKLRRHLPLAGLDRDELFANDDQRRPLDFHDLRHSWASWLALAGVDVQVIKQRGGWADFVILQRYVEEAEAVGRGDIGKPFPALPASLVAAVATAESAIESATIDEGSGENRYFYRERDTGFEPATPSLGSSCSTN